MKARCAQCHEVFTVSEGGQQTCPNCGAVLELNTPDSAQFSSSAGNGWPKNDSHQDEETVETPWEKRGEIGVFKGFFDTVVKSITEPTPFFAKMPRDNADGALSYYVLMTLITGILSYIFVFPLKKIMPQNQNTAQALEHLNSLRETVGSNGQFVIDMLQSMISGESLIGGAVCTVVCVLLFTPISLFAAAGVTHLSFMLFGSKQGFSSTLRAIGYSCAPNILTVVPVIGNFLGPLGVLIYGIIACAAVHRFSGVRAVAAYLAPMLTLVCLACGGAILMFTTIAQGLP